MFLRLAETGCKLLVGLLVMQGMLRLDTAMVRREDRVALLKAYESTEVFGFEFPHELHENSDADGNYENRAELCAGL